MLLPRLQYLDQRSNAVVGVVAEHVAPQHVLLVGLRGVDNLCLEELGNVKDEAECDDRDDIHDDTLVDTGSVDDVTIGVRVAH